MNGQAGHYMECSGQPLEAWGPLVGAAIFRRASNDVDGPAPDRGAPKNEGLVEEEEAGGGGEGCLQTHPLADAPSLI